VAAYRVGALPLRGGRAKAKVEKLLHHGIRKYSPLPLLNHVQELVTASLRKPDDPCMIDDRALAVWLDLVAPVSKALYSL
jgi:hypothetical protein